MENYHILGRIGEGAHGIVFKAKHIQVKHICKVVHLLKTYFIQDWGACCTKEGTTEKTRGWHTHCSSKVT